MARNGRRSKDPLTRCIESRERGIKRMRDNIARIRKDAEQRIAEVELRVREKQVLLDALKRGRLKAS